MKLSWHLWVAFFCLLATTGFLGWTIRDQTFEPQTIIKVEYREIEKLIPQIVVFPYETTFMPYLTGEPSLEDVMSIVRSGREAHQFYIDYPERQNAMTGDTAFNEVWVRNYNNLEQWILSMK